VLRWASQDWLVFAGFVSGFLLNLILLTQALVLPNPTLS
jgi:hypothetical protein